MKYIDAEKLKAEIERLKQENTISDDKEYAQYELDVACGYDMALEKVLLILNSLQQEQPEVDLEKEIVLNYAHEHYYYDKDFDGYGHSKFRPVFTRDDLIGFARHFYLLGLNARKEE